MGVVTVFVFDDSKQQDNGHKFCDLNREIHAHTQTWILTYK